MYLDYRGFDLNNNFTSAYTAASGSFPVKIIKSLDLTTSVLKGNAILPLHIQLNPTNKCNLNCSFCSCSERDKKLELSLDEIKEIFDKFSDLGCRAVTITGGGEPLVHPNIEEIVEAAIERQISVGLVTNGKNIAKVSPDMFAMCTWVRISVSNESPFDEFQISFMKANLQAIKTDWSFSYVVTQNPDIDTISGMIKFANSYKFTHVRIVNDIFKPVCDLDSVRRRIIKAKVDDNLVIWQDRRRYSVGFKKCHISLLKPVIGADGSIYPCCGAQYAESVPAHDYPRSMKMGDIWDITNIWDRQLVFDGSHCVKCYYEHYNYALDALISDIDHVEFV